MKKIALLIPLILLNSCGLFLEDEDVISLYTDKSHLYEETFDEKHCALLKTYHHKKFGEIPYVDINEFCDTFEKTDISVKVNCEIKDEKFIISGNNKGTYTFDAKKDTITTSSDVHLIFEKFRNQNNNVPFDIYRNKELPTFVKESSKTTYLGEGSERVYDCKKYNFDIVYEDGKYYAPFSVLSYVFYGFLNNAFIYNGKNYFDCDCITGEDPVGPYCYSSNGNFLLDRSGGKLGAVLFKKVDPKEANEAYRFENIIESNQQLTVFSLLKDGTGTLNTYDKNNQLIDDGVYVKVNYKVDEENKELTMNYFSVLDLADTQPISDISTIRINLDETNFGKKTRSKEVADFTYQELRFYIYELYGDTTNEAVKDFDNFIKDKEYKDDLLSLDIKKYDEAMAKFLLQGVDDAHTTIEYPSIYDEPSFANANYYSLKYEGSRRKTITDSLIQNRNQRKEAGLSDGGLDIVNQTAFIAFDDFSTDKDIKGINEYKDSNPKDYAENPMHLFASSFNKIKENSNIKNVVIDLTCNGGGKVSGLSYLLGYLTKDPSIVVNVKLNNLLIDYHYEVDLDQDGVFASDNDTFMGKYNFYILTSSASFSCANHLATLCRNLGLGKVIGERSAGGACIISKICNSTGYLYNSSSEYICQLKENGKYSSNDYGVEPDIKLEHSKLFDHQYIDQLLSK